MKFQVLIIILLFSCAAFGQTKKTPVKHELTTGEVIRNDIKKLTPEQKDVYLKLLKKLDGADAEFFINKNAFNYSKGIQDAFEFFDDNSKDYENSTLNSAISLMLLNYVDASILIRLGAIREKDGYVELSDAQKENLGEMQRRYDRLLNLGTAVDLLDSENVSKILASAINLKTGMRSFFE